MRRITEAVTEPVLVIGAGPAGLAVAAALKRRGVRVRVVDEADRVGAAWRGHYDRLRLHTVRWGSQLPGYRIPRRFGSWVARDDVVRYLEDYTRAHGLGIDTGVHVERIERLDGRWAARTSRGDLSAATVVVATGYNHRPWLPDWPGRDGFTGEVLHASRYRSAAGYRGKDVLVVGSGNTGAEIATDLAESGAARVRLSVRTSPTVIRRALGPIPTQATAIVLRRLPPRLVDHLIGVTSRLTTPDLAAYGLPRPKPNVYTRLLADGTIPIIDVGLIDAVTARKVTVVPAVTGFEGAQILLAGAASITADIVIAATGYTSGLEPLVGHLGVLNDRGLPRYLGPRTDPDAPGLYFIGFTTAISGMLREISLDARKIARAVASGQQPLAHEPG